VTGVTDGIVAGYDGSPGGEQASWWGRAGTAAAADPWLGSVAWRVASHAQGRVVVVRGPWQPVNKSPGPVVVSPDGSLGSQAGITFAFEEAGLREVPLVAVCALADAPGSLGGRRHMEEGFGRMITLQEKEHPEAIVLRHVAVSSPRPALLTAAAEAQMLVVGSRGLGGLEGMSLGSVAQAMLDHPPCPSRSSTRLRADPDVAPRCASAGRDFLAYAG
jgi:nucleotide-binding universal stress UspA family protein